MGRRLPIRLKLTLAFAVVMALALSATGLFIYLRLGNDLDATLDQGLRSRAGDVQALVRQADSGLAQAGRSPLTDEGESFAQILDQSGEIVDASAPMRGRPLLDARELARARAHTFLVNRDAAPGAEGPVRLLVTPVRAEGRSLIVVVGTSTEDRSDAQRNLGALLLIGGPIALLVACAAGYGVAAAALRPVEAMRRRAAQVSATEPGGRLPVPPSRDEISRLGETLNDMLSRLEGAFARERTFVSDASHELRTPLAILKTELELAMRAGRSPEELRAAVRSAAEETDRLSQLAEDLLVIARSDQGRLPVRLAEVDVAAMLEDVARRFEARVREGGATLEAHVPEGLVVAADPLRLEQAVGNMVDNALRHGGRNIAMVADEQRDGVRVQVHDDGAGFPAGFVGSAFERFTRGDHARGRGGAGLGLAIVAAIAAAHGGRVGADSPEGGGADVWIWLPVSP
jgi:two-component system OmpR family sensor kinase